MPGLSRVAALYRLLERVREAEAMIASAAVAETEQARDALRIRDAVTRLELQDGITSPELRTSTMLVIANHSVLEERLQELRAQRVTVWHDAMQQLVDSRVQSRQVEETVEAAERQEKAESDKREQAADDERFLVQWHARQQR